MIDLNPQAPAAIQPYRDAHEHLQDEMRRLDLYLKRAIARFRRSVQQRGEMPFAGLFIPDAEVDNLLDDADAGIPDGGELDARIDAMTRLIETRIEANRRERVPLRLTHLGDTFGLDRREMEIVVLALAPEIDLRYQRLYAYVQDDVNRKRPTVELAMRLFCNNEAERLAYRRYFAESSTLLAVPLITLHEDPAERPAPLLGHSLKLEDRIAEFLAGSDSLEARFIVKGDAVRWIIPEHGLDRLLLRPEVRSVAGRLAADREADHICVLEGSAGTGKKSIAGAIANAQVMPLLIMHVSSLLRGETSPRATLRAAIREARLYSGALYLDGWELLEEDAPGLREPAEMILEELNAAPVRIYIATRLPWKPSHRLRRPVAALKIAMPDERERMELWTRALAASGAAADPAIDIAYFAGAYRFSGGRILGALARALVRMQLRADAGPMLTADDLRIGCREESSRFIISFARRIEPRRVWEDLVLPADVMQQLREFCRQVRHRTTVYGDWGFAHRLSSGKGTIALFTGTSGTGKTLSAEVLARELGLDLFRVDLSSVVSKYIGETEKNLDRVFRDAQESNAILFFDEADALFGKRSEVKDAHDRYANIEINYLLQRVEEYEGVIILASNLSKNIDQAFIRRLHFSIEFPFPDETYRARIWQRVFPKETPVGADIDLPFVSRQFKIAGGNIRNVALAAAFHAAEENVPVGMEHLILAMKREYQKLGRTCERADFEQYFDLVR
ncbi:MAG: ATP-binding protein [Bacteroidetes bacterium]|nr:ATP-binding protein [Bacteroidota bacterium]